MSTITVRDAKIEDAARILEIYAYYVEHTVISFEWDVPSLEEFENRMRRGQRTDGHMRNPRFFHLFRSRDTGISS